MTRIPMPLNYWPINYLMSLTQNAVSLAHLERLLVNLFNDAVTPTRCALGATRRTA